MTIYLKQNQDKLLKEGANREKKLKCNTEMHDNIFHPSPHPLKNQMVTP